MKATVSHSVFFALINQLPRMNKEDVVWEYSGMLTTSLSEFYNTNKAGYDKMIYDLKRLVNDQKEAKNRAVAMSEAEEKRIKKLRSGILKRLQKYGVDTTDWNKVNAFMKQPKIAGKLLYEMTIPEMETLTKKLESILKKEEAVKEEHNRLAHWN
ncbi:hypothetical protein [Paludibacter sp.]|uniref:hypothetical protein n=1 Tax=Paludibacter sp. TaxID=1898105 RepID=UPI00135233C1|nr:hypothetical protein [Paludibacter sp.]MTK53322.1 hypothetical protein [Paludibacter sp.]